MTGIGLYGDFFYSGDEYAMRHFSETDYCDKEVLYFQNKKELRALLSMMMRHAGGSAWTAFNTVIQEISPGMCETMGDECDGQTLDFLCEKIYNQEWVLIKRIYADDCETLRFEECCIKSIITIKDLIRDEKMLIVVLCFAKVQGVFASHPQLNGLASMLGSVYVGKMGHEDGKDLAMAVKGLPSVTQRTIKQIAELEYHDHHDKDNNLELGNYWKRIYDGFNQ